MTSRRVIVNLIVFLIASGSLITMGITQFVLRAGEGLRITADFSDAGGLGPRNDITMRGVTVGTVTSVRLTPTGARVELAFAPGTEVPTGSQLFATRRSPIGDVVVEVTPGAGAPMSNGDNIPVFSTKPPPDAGRSIEVLADLLEAVPADDLATVVDELAAALEGRGEDLGRLSEVAADLPERILEVNDELRALIETGPKVTKVFADSADVLADDITRTAQLVDILRDRRFDLLELYRNGAEFSEVAGELIADEKANISCLIRDFAHVNEVLATAQNLKRLTDVFKLNHFFFGGVNQIVQVGLDGQTWFRVQLLPHQEPPARSYAPHRDAPDVRAGNACRSPFGDGVPATTKSDGTVILAPDSKVIDGR